MVVSWLLKLHVVWCKKGVVISLNMHNTKTRCSQASFAPPVVHRDIKPANILLEFDNSSQRPGAHEILMLTVLTFESVFVPSGNLT